MKVKDLIKLLRLEDPDRIVVMSKDPEGNNFSPLWEASTCAYRADNTWSGEIHPEVLTEDLRKQGWNEEDIKGGEKALCLWPTN